MVLIGLPLSGGTSLNRSRRIQHHRASHCDNTFVSCPATDTIVQSCLSQDGARLRLAREIPAMTQSITHPLNILLQTTIEPTANDWHIGRFSLLRDYLASLTGADG